MSSLAPAQTSLQAWDSRFHLGGAPGADVLEVYDDGSGPALYVGGGLSRVDDLTVNRIARWDGRSWAPLGTGLTTNSGNPAQVMSMVVFDDGSGPELYVGGRFTRAGSENASGIARWNGTRWARVGSGAASAGIEVRALTVFDDGSGPALYAGGFFSSIGGTAARGIARWNGTSWTPLGTGFSSFFNSPGIVETLTGFQGKLYAGGEFQLVDGVPASNLACWNGTKWQALGLGALRQFSTLARVHALEVCADERGEFLAVGGDFNRLDGRTFESVGRWNGAFFEPFGSGLPFGAVHSLAQFDAGSGLALYAGGVFFLPGGPRVSVARWDGRAWAVVGDDLAIEGGTGPVTDFASFDAGAGKTLFAAGSFDHSGQRVVVGLAQLRDGAWHPASASGQGIQQDINASGVTPVSALTVWDDGSGAALFAGGNFVFAGTTRAQRIARWDGASWAPLGQGLAGFFSDSVLALEVFDGGTGPALHAGGSFVTAGGAMASAIARWDGVAWWPVGGGLGATRLGFRPVVHAFEVFDDGSGPALFVGGAFSEAGGTPVMSLARWDGASWSDVGGGLSEFSFPAAYSLAVFDDGSGEALYVGGRFDAVGGLATSGVARWDGTSWSAVGGDFGDSGEVYALAVFDDGSGAALYAGGQFATAGGVTAHNLARWDGATWTPVGLNGRVNALAVHDDGTGPALYAGGEFSATTTGQTLRRIGRFDGSAWTVLASGVDGTLTQVAALCSYSHDGIPALYAGGEFEQVAGRRSANVARWFGDLRRRTRR
ncbi:MAG TPA: hypothetical protein VF530_22825 [Planctomycetota bacterium]